MSIPLRQSARIAHYLLKQKVKRTDKYPLLVELEPLFQCNLACSFCGKIQYPQHILKQRMPVDKALAAYNAGPNRVSSWARARPPQSAEEFIESIPFQETRSYVMTILANREHYRRIYGLSTGTPLEVGAAR